MPTPTRTPTLAEVLDLAVNAGLAGARVCLPGRVESYDASTGLVSVQPLLKETAVAPDGSELSESLPVINGVPVVFPGAGGFVLTFPVQVGDTVLLVFADRSLDLWTGGEVDPIDLRRHHLSDAIAIPGLKPSAWGNAAAATDHATLGKDNALRMHLKSSTVEIGEAAADAAALASKVLARLNALESYITTHVHPVPALALDIPNLLTLPGPTSAPAVPPTPSTDVSSTLLKLTS